MMETGSRSVSSMQEQVEQLEQALQQVSAAKKQLYRNTSEAKSRIQCNVSRQLETLRNREVWLLNQLDIVSSAKEEVLQQQSARLHKTLGVLQTGLAFPSDTNNLDIIDTDDLRPEETPYISFKADCTELRNAIMNYGKIDCNDVAPLKSPFAAPDQPAPSLPRHFEDYDDAEHHVLYKTVEEINRARTEQPCVNVNIPKLLVSSRIEDWLAKTPSTMTASTNSAPKFSFPTLSNKLSDWLISTPVAMSSRVQSMKEQPREPLIRTTSDASIKNWLHKIKQNPFEEEEEDFEFIEEMSGTGTQGSVEVLETFPEPVAYPGYLQDWLYKGPSSAVDTDVLPTFKVRDMPLDKWLFRGSKPASVSSGSIDMSRYFNKITDELDKWLAIGSSSLQKEAAQMEDCSRPSAPRTLGLHASFSQTMTHSDNPWLHKACTASPVNSRRSSTSSLSSLASQPQQSGDFRKWLRSTQQDNPAGTRVTCSFMEKYQTKMKSLSWLKGPDKGSGQSQAHFSFLALKNTDSSRWLKATNPGTAEQPVKQNSAIQNGFEKFNLKSQDYWLGKSTPPSSKLESFSDICSSLTKDSGEPEGRWLLHTEKPYPSLEDDDIEIEEL